MIEGTTALKHLTPSVIPLFNKDLLSPYARRIVRREFFLLLCSPGHPCVSEEDRLVAISEHEIATVIKRGGLAPPSSSLREAFTSYIMRLMLADIGASEYEKDMRDAVASRVASYDLLTPFEIARFEASA